MKSKLTSTYHKAYHRITKKELIAFRVPDDIKVCKKIIELIRGWGISVGVLEHLNFILGYKKKLEYIKDLDDLVNRLQDLCTTPVLLEWEHYTYEPFLQTLSRAVRAHMYCEYVDNHRGDNGAEWRGFKFPKDLEDRARIINALEDSGWGKRYKGKKQ